jgi:hypothetical protein
MISVERGFNNILFSGNLGGMGSSVPDEGGVTGVSLRAVSSRPRVLLAKLFPSLFAVEWLSSISSSAKIGLSSMMSVSRLLRLLELMVEVDVEFVSRAMLSRVMSLGVDVSSRKSLSRKKFKTVCK